MQSLLDGTLTVTLIPTLRPTLALLRQRLFLFYLFSHSQNLTQHEQKVLIKL